MLQEINVKKLSPRSIWSIADTIASQIQKLACEIEYSPNVKKKERVEWQPEEEEK